MFSSKTLLAIVLFFGSCAFGATASPVTVSSTTVSGTTVTVTTAAAHGLSANQGFCGFTTAYCGVVASVPTSTTFTYTQSGVTACAAACGTVLPAKKVIILDTIQQGSGVNAHYLCWGTTAQPIARAGATSAWSGAGTAENAAIAAGFFIEQSRNFFVPNGMTLAQAQAEMTNDCAALQTALAAGVQPGQFYGDYFDTGWLQ